MVWRGSAFGMRVILAALFSAAVECVIDSCFFCSEGGHRWV